MNPVRYFNFFRKFINNELDVLGIKLIPKSINDDYRIVFGLKNPQDLSYTLPCLYGYVQEEFQRFHVILGGAPHDNKYGIFHLDCPQIYVNNDLLTKTESILKSKKHLTLPPRKDKEHSLIFNVTNVDLKYSIVDKEIIKLTNFVKVNEVYDTKNGLSILDTKESILSIKKYEDYIIHRRFDDSEVNYMDIDSLLHNYPTFEDYEWQVNYTVTEFVSGL